MRERERERERERKREREREREKERESNHIAYRPHPLNGIVAVCSQWEFAKVDQFAPQK